MCEISTKRVFAFPFVVRKAEFCNNCGPSETSCIILRTNQLPRVIEDRRGKNEMGIDDFCESLSC